MFHRKLQYEGCFCIMRCVHESDLHLCWLIAVIYINAKDFFAQSTTYDAFKV
jgi:energy-converting hydrogenase A subunit M